jgi:hypothetical protein
MTLVRETVLGQGTPFEMRLVTLLCRQVKAPTVGGPNFLNGPCGFSEILFPRVEGFDSATDGVAHEILWRECHL